MANAISILATQFWVQRITLVGDKGMLGGPQIKGLTAVQFNYITAISKPEIRAMLSIGLIQLKSPLAPRNQARGKKSIITA